MKALKDGASFALIAPSSQADEDLVRKGEQVLAGYGFKTIRCKGLSLGWEGYGGTISARVEALHWAFAVSEADAVLAVRGGYGAIQLLEHLDYKLLAAHPKPFIGYSDITSLHMALAARAGFPTVHGAMLISDMAAKPPPSTELLLNYLRGGSLSLPFQTLRAGKARGRLLGGNLAVFMSSLNTPYMPPLEGALLFFEDVGEAAHRIDRMLHTLRHTGVLARCAGLIFGDFIEKGDEHGECSAEGYGEYVLRAIEESTAGLSIPIVRGLPCGHCSPNYPLLWGKEYTLDTDLGLLDLPRLE